MELVKCSKGHFYDKNLDKCPYCESMEDEVKSGMGITQPLNQNIQVVEEKEENIVKQEAVQKEEPNENGSKPVTAQRMYQEMGERAFSQPQPRRESFWDIPEDENRTVSYYSRTMGTEPVVGYLIAIEGAYFGEGFKLKTGRNFIGRSPEMDIQLSLDLSVSRRKHAIIIYEPRARIFIAQPGESRELFYLNDQVVLNNVTMKPYDILTIGETKLLLLPLCGENFTWDDYKK
ncbi:MAG TPA: FHA domain-containing protein [Candidatus Choladousia intestinigallinarum]|nr:FHA domain-containing protein [Candidatus Choladousia intestinigallinarum]